MKRILMKLARRTIPLAFLCAFLCVSAAALENPFSDVRRDAPYYDAVMWALETGVTAGTSSTAFSPAATCNRGQVVTFLWRMAGQPEPTSDYNPFSDVGRSSFCYKAVLWAVQQEITNGTTDDTFSPGNLCTYAHVLTFLWRYVGVPAPAGQGAYAGAWYADALAWADENGILSGASFTPTNPCPRSDIVSFLYRWARLASLSQYPELAVDRAPIPERDLQGTYRGAGLEFILEVQSDGGDEKQGLLFLIQNAYTGDFIGSCERAGVNFYKSDVYSSGEFAVGFSRVDGVIYLDYYRNNVHMGKIPRVSFDELLDDSDADDVSTGEQVGLSAFVGTWQEAEYETYPRMKITPLDSKRCQITIWYKYYMWEATGEYDADLSRISYKDGVYSSRDRGGDWEVEETGCSGWIFYESPGLLRWLDNNEGNELYFAPYVDSTDE